MKEFIDETAEKAGTDINRAALMAIQGFASSKVEFNGNVITETFATGEVLTVTFNEDNSITEELTGEKTIKKVTTFNNDESIEGAVS